MGKENWGEYKEPLPLNESMPETNPLMNSKWLSFVAVGFVCALFGLIVGCGKSTVEAVPRDSKSKPVFGTSESPRAAAKSSDINFDFVHPDHFACVCLNVAQIISNKELKELPLDFLEDEIGELAGQANSKLHQIDRIWVLVDRESVSMAMEGKTDGMLVWVIDYMSAPNAQSLAAASSIRSKGPEPSDLHSDDSNQQLNEANQVVAELMGERQIVIGSHQLVEKMKRPQEPSDLSRQMSRLDFDADIEGTISVGPVRETLKSVFGLAAQFGGEEAKKIAALSDVLEEVEFRLTLEGDDSEDLLSFQAKVDDKQIVKDIVRASQKAINQSGTGFGGDADSNGLAAIFGKRFESGQDEDESNSIFPLATPQAGEAFAKEIEENDLFGVEGAENSVSFRLSRPKSTAKFVKALATDAKRGAELQRRVAKMEEIAVAMKLYHESHGFFPPPGTVKPEEGRETAVPPQLNWRVGLLPFLGQQSLYEKFDFDQDWDSEFNSKIAESIPDVFSCQAVDQATATRLHLPGGELGMFASAAAITPQSLKEITDKKIWTAIVVESELAHQVVWTQPGVCPVDREAISTSAIPLGRMDENGVLIVSAAFKARAVRKNPQALTSVLTAQGNETLTRSSFFSLSPN